ncbi:uncharacterized protein LOC142164084 [Nicotiana tabacum]|uniref:Uncharacterized protein LOC142164084 n=1 Tax=Nicotiana tabacum TaxID=4097 RepID=A0AC58RX72_TOBAC
MSAPSRNWDGQSTTRPPLFNGQYYYWSRCVKDKSGLHYCGLKEVGEKNTKAKKYLICGLGLDEYNRIQGYATAKQIWDTLQVAHEGTTQVKRSRGTLQYFQYENFAMKDGETIQEMYIRFTTHTNELKSLGRIILEEERVEKILTRVWL